MTFQIGGRAWGRAHVEHVAHVRDAGGVEAQRLVERRRVLPRAERGAYGAGRGAAREAGGRRVTAVHAACRGGELDCRSGARHGEERTTNIWYMFVTLEVSKLSGWLNADAFCGVSRGGHARCGARVRASRRGRLRPACAVEARLQIGGRARGGAHLEHLVHGRDAGGVPAGDVLVEILQVIEELLHVGDGRDVPLGDGAALRSGGSRVSVVGLDLRHQGGLGREDTGRGRRWARRGRW